MLELTGYTLLGVAVAIALVAVIIVVGIISLATRVIARRWPGVYRSFGPARRRLRVLLFVVATWIAVSLTLPEPAWRSTINQVFTILVIGASAWLLSAVVRLLFDRVQRRYDITADDNRVARRIQTQLTIVRRLATVIIGVLALAAMLLTFPGAQAAGASLLASAGLVSVVAGLAAQSSLANVFAGM
ncbi:hypothetical protein [Microcella sp.]|uniref:hypothetical protein n=1 Tax=Microcella sp. TaxID=1913979 RepID=UPI0025E0EA95|nr:hypothetical protein [Microcella sp.]